MTNTEKDAVENNSQKLCITDPEVFKIKRDKPWNRFMEIVNAGKQDQTFPRKTVMLDNDLYRSCKELNLVIDKNCVSNISELVNAIVRSFMETYLTNLEYFYRPVEAKSIFENKL